ncbi:predicted protein [Uncinocarpus reesii 1704]|uniref:Dihydrofolate reductase n=1 Tax=Uncinocarpus reesii (strain UAMH 1704) TaxID=336963 RepID=C4JED0_UNCRE|nr:uncharacterized protein UREG_00769 [Uncinocarpus reesii 1704]EEP75922.1 predicted protein [Uncinocarpus reesii 1704]
MSPHCPPATAAAFANSATKLPPLTLVVATTPITLPCQPQGISRLGIGHGGTLPWPRIKPLPKRLNVIITRDESGMVCERAVVEWRAAKERERQKERECHSETATECKKCSSADKDDSIDGQQEENPDILVSNSVESALTTLQDNFGLFSQGGKRSLGSVLVIGGGEIYASSLSLDSSTFGHKMRIVVTDVRRPATEVEKNEPSNSTNGFDCDTFFPVDHLIGNEEWREASPAEVSEWVGEKIPEGWVWERDVAVRFLGFERK